MITKRHLGYLVLGVFIVYFCVQAGIVVVLAENQIIITSGSQTEEIDPEVLESFLDGYIPDQMERSHVPGLVITIVQGDEVLVSKGYGYADLENELPMTPQTNIRAGSLSKSVTATAVIKLVEQGILDLDAPVSEYITDLDLEDEYGPASTIGQLLSHMGGYPDNPMLSHSPDIEGWEPLGDVLRTDLPRRAFAPGLVSAYSDWNFSLLGYAIEGATGKVYDQAIAELLFEPLGMEKSTYTQPLPDAIGENLAKGYGWVYSKVSYELVPHDFVRMSPGIALVTTGEDMAKFMLMLLNDGSLDGSQVLGAESVTRLIERQGSAHPYSRGWSYGFTELNISGRQVMYKDGNGIGFANRMVLMPEQDFGIFISTNHRNLGEGLWVTEAAVMATRSLVTEIMENFVPESEIEAREVQPLPGGSDDIKRYTGHYQKAGISRTDFFKLEGLMDNVDVRDNGDGKLRIGSRLYQEVEPLVFQNVENPDFFVIFVEDLKSEVEFLTFGGTGSYQKVAWYQSVSFQILLLGTITLISLVMLVVWPFTRQGHWLVWVVSLLNLGFIAGVAILFVPSVTDLLNFFKTIPPGVQILFYIPWIIGILALITLLFLFRMWKDESFSMWGRVLNILLIFASFGLFWLANFWKFI